MIKKIFCGIALLFTLALVGCGSKGSQKKNKEISEKNFITMFSELCARYSGFDDEPTFKDDPENSEYEIGYEWDFQKNYGDTDDDNDYTALIAHRRIRRDKETKDFIYSTDLDNDPSGETFTVYYIGKKQGIYDVGFYQVTYPNGFLSQEVKSISYKDVFKKVKIDFWEISEDEVVKSFNKDNNSFSFTLKGDKEETKSSFKPFMTIRGLSFVARMSNGDTVFYQSFESRQKIIDANYKTTQTN